MRTVDGGFFGHGIYLAQEVEYAIKYGKMKRDARTQEFVVFLCCIAVGAAYPITPEDPDYPHKQQQESPTEWKASGYSRFYSDKTEPAKALETGFNCHYIPVAFVGGPLDYQACDPSSAEFHEIVVKEENVLPLVALWFK